VTGLTDVWVVPSLAFLAGWSVRWGLVLAALGVWFALRPPRRAATRHLLCAVALAAGMLLPVVPHWWVATISWPSRRADVAAQRGTHPTIARAEPFASGISPEHDARPPGRTSMAVARPVSRVPDREGLGDRLPRAALGTWRVVMLGVAGLWVSAVLVLSARLAGGRLLLAKLRGSAVSGGDTSDRLLDECRRAVRLSRPVALAAHSAVASPVALGGRRPLVLVPPDWDGWPESHRRDCLLHELTHLARYDDWAKLAEELVRVPFFFHPLVIWLLNRLDRERELLCDEAVVAFGAEPLGYARLLLDLARRPGRLLPSATALRPGWLPFFDRGTVAVRINRLLEDDMARSLSPPSVRRPFAVGAVAFAAALGIGGLHIRAVEPQAKKDDQPATPAVRAEPAAAARNIEVRPDELAGVVVDTQGKPIEAVEVDAWTWYPGHETKTDQKGVFRIGNLDKGRKVEIRFRKPGYTPQLFLTQPTGVAGWVVVLGEKTYFEGKVTGPDGKPAAGALIRANNGPKMADGVMITEIWTEAKTDKAGRYRMYAQADGYDIQVRMPGVGVARLPGTAIGNDEAKQLDIRLQPGVNFRAKTVDAGTGRPVAGVRLSHWQHPGIEGRSDKEGLLTIADMMPGRFNFQVESEGNTRWWSDQAASEWSRRKIDESRGGWQRNFDGLDFDLESGMGPVTITLERGVKITGRVIDPDGKPVAGATVAPALTGTGNSLTGDTRFSVETTAEGKFTMLLPASGDREYNLVAHDGKYEEWRTWANGVLLPIRTKPREEINDVTLRLTRGATVRGRVTDAQGKPVAGHEVRASAADRRENRYYDPTTTTRDDGTYELKYVRPGEQFIQVAPFWLDAKEAPEGSSQTLTLAPGKSKDGVNFQIQRRDGKD